MLTLSTIRATGESDLESLMQQFDDKHKALLRDAIKKHGINNVPQAVWNEIQTNIEEGTVSAIILLLMMADDWTTEEIKSQGIVTRSLSGQLQDTYSRVAAAQSRTVAVDSTRELRMRLTRKLQDQALTGEGAIGDVTDSGIDEALDDVFTTGRRHGVAVNATTDAMTFGHRGAKERTIAGDGASLTGDGTRVTVELLWINHPEESESGPCEKCAPLHMQPEKVWSRVYPAGPGSGVHKGCVCTLQIRIVPYFEDSE